MTQWHDLPKEVHLTIIKFTVANILKDHVKRIPSGRYWGAPQDYEDDTECDSITKHGDGCEYSEPYNHSQLTSLLFVSKTFLTAVSLDSTLLDCGLVRWTDPQPLSQSKIHFTSQQRKRIDTMWIRPNRISRDDCRDSFYFGPEDTGVSLYRCLLYFPSLKLINIQLEQYLQAVVEVCKNKEGRLYENQDILNSVIYKPPNHSPWAQASLDKLLKESVILTNKVEMRISFEAELLNYKNRCLRVAVFSSKDFHVRFEYMGQQMAIKQHREEHLQRTEVIKEGKRSTFDNLPNSVRILIEARK